MVCPCVRFLLFLMLILNFIGETRDLTLEEVSSVKCFQNPVSTDCRLWCLQYM